MFYLADSIHLILILPSGELTFCHGKIHHAINGKIHYFDWAIFNSKLLVHQRVFDMNADITDVNLDQINTSKAMFGT